MCHELGLHVDVSRVTRPTRRDPYTAQLEQESEAMRQQSEADRQRIASLEAAQREIRLFMAQFTASQQSARELNSESDNTGDEDNDEA